MVELPRAKAFPAIAPNGSSLPYPVRPKGWAFYTSLIVCSLLILLSFGVATLMAPALGTGSSAWLGLLPTLLVGTVAAYQLWLLYSPNVILYVDRLEVRRLFRDRQSLSRSQIRGVGRTIYSRSGSYFEIIPQSPTDGAIRLPASARKDPIVAAWLEGAQDPEAEMRAADKAAVLSDPRFGSTETERADKLKQAKTFVSIFTVASVGLAVWTYVSLTPYALTLAAPVAAPVAAWLLVKRFDGLVLWFGKPGVRPQVGVFSGFPATAIGIASMFHNRLYDPWTFAGVAAVLGFGGAAAVYAASKTDFERRNVPILAGLAIGLGAFGLASTADVALDQAKTRVIPVQVLDKHVYHGKSTSYELTLGAWPGHAQGDVEVGSGLYDAVPIGVDVCVRHHPGALNLPWFTVEACSAGMHPVLSAAQASGSAQFYPERAQRLEVEGLVRLSCPVASDLTLTHCQIESESPQGYGFGEAALARVQNGGIKLRQVPPGGVFQTSVRFQLAR